MNDLAIEPRYAVLLSEQVDPAHFTVTRHTTFTYRSYVYEYKTTRYVRNMLHSVDDNPAVIRHYPASAFYSYDWYRYGVAHRDNDRPSRYSTCVRLGVGMTWSRNGALHRDGGRPAVMRAQSVGVIMGWFLHDVRHFRDGRPAAIYNQ